MTILGPKGQLMPQALWRKILVCVIVAIILPPLVLMTRGTRWYKALRLKAYDLTARYYHLAIPTAWWN